MSLESVREFLKENAPDIEIIISQEVTHTVQMAADALGVKPEEIAKSIALKADDKVLILVTSGIKKLDNAKFKSIFKTKPRMLELEEAATITGHPIGGVTPIGLANPLSIYFDESLKAFEYVYPAAGSVNSAFKITPERFARIAGAEWVDVCK